MIAESLTSPSLLAPHLLAWRPFLDPINIHEWWWVTIVPLAFGISMAYKAIRVKTLDRYWMNVFVMTAQVVGAMILLAAGAHVVLEWLVPLVV